MAFPTPDDPLRKRVIAAVLMTVLMPVIFPLFAAIFLFLWVIMGFLLALCSLIVLGLPYAAFRGVEEKTTTKFEVEVDNDKVVDFKAAAASTGAKVEEK